MRAPIRQIDRFAEVLSQWTAAEDATDVCPADPGGNAGEAARRIGLSRASGNGMLQRLRRDLGPQAR